MSSASVSMLVLVAAVDPSGFVISGVIMIVLGSVAFREMFWPLGPLASQV